MINVKVPLNSQTEMIKNECNYLLGAAAYNTYSKNKDTKTSGELKNISKYIMKIIPHFKEILKSIFDIYVNVV